MEADEFFPRPELVRNHLAARVGHVALLERLWRIELVQATGLQGCVRAYDGSPMLGFH